MESAGGVGRFAPFAFGSLTLDVLLTVTGQDGIEDRVQVGLGVLVMGQAI